MIETKMSNEKEEIGNRIKKAREDKGLKSGELAVLCGWEDSKSRISNYEKGISSPSYPDMAKIGIALGVNPAWLAFGELEGSDSREQKSTSEAEFIASEIEPWDSNTPIEDDEVEIPFFTEVEAAAGNGNLVYIENQGPKLRFSKSTLRRAGVDPSTAVCIKVTGNSMEPVIPDGAVIGIDTTSVSVKDGSIYAIKHGDMLRVKIVYRLPEGGFRLKSFNESDHPIETVDSDKITIAGRVFWWSVLVPK